MKARRRWKFGTAWTSKENKSVEFIDSKTDKVLSLRKHLYQLYLLLLASQMYHLEEFVQNQCNRCFEFLLHKSVEARRKRALNVQINIPKQHICKNCNIRVLCGIFPLGYEKEFIRSIMADLTLTMNQSDTLRTYLVTRYANQVSRHTRNCIKFVSQRQKL